MQERSAGVRRRLALLVCGAGLLLTATGCDSGAREREFWGVRCITLRGPERFRLAKDFAESLRRVDGLDAGQVYVIQEEDAGHVYYGRYERAWDAWSGERKFTPDPTNDLDLIQSLSYDQVNRPFAGAALDPYPSEPIGNPEWDLAAAQGYWSLQVAAFYNTKNMQRRKYAAAEYCKVLRDQGVEAYYYHGKTVSSVCVGVFPKEALETVTQRTVGLDGRPTTASLNQIKDPRLAELKERFPHNLENGHRMYEIRVNPTSGEKTRTPRPSVIVKLPGVDEPRETSVFGGGS